MIFENALLPLYVSGKERLVFLSGWMLRFSMGGWAWWSLSHFEDRSPPPKPLIEIFFSVMRISGFEQIRFFPPR